MTENVNPGNPQPPVPPRRGQVSHQDPSRTRARPATLAEQRARQEADEAELAARQAEIAEAERKAKLRKRLLIGGGVTVGVVALVAIWYAAQQPDDVTARCVDQDGVVVDDDYCDDDYARSHGGTSHGGGGIFIYNGGRQYSYNYGGTGTKGQKITGGSSIRPKDANISTASGKSIQRGGFGIRGGSGGSSGSSGSSGGS
ncbi:MULTISPECIES: hypothetical protein [unclassified Crossiella]|uniref:hypothetical protein n=1 Tax=unclassified Crossiella TaxID=2620835 RepID=UPI001FFF1F1D|nr:MULTISPECIES: hypothetical protein [unclassified Crossiella]MCK2237510.1 hypothetical protein [Crossiella sp. S99.2]MCK2254796.1 hypothetical protein [Crossiella sp. S99.1]